MKNELSAQEIIKRYDLDIVHTAAEMTGAELHDTERVNGLYTVIEQMYVALKAGQPVGSATIRLCEIALLTTTRHRTMMAAQERNIQLEQCEDITATVFEMWRMELEARFAEVA